MRDLNLTKSMNQKRRNFDDRNADQQQTETQKQMNNIKKEVAKPITTQNIRTYCK